MLVQHNLFCFPWHKSPLYHIYCLEITRYILQCTVLLDLYRRLSCGHEGPSSSSPFCIFKPEKVIQTKPPLQNTTFSPFRQLPLWGAVWLRASKKSAYGVWKKVLTFCTVVSLNKCELQCSSSPAVPTPNEAGQTQAKLCSWCSELAVTADWFQTSCWCCWW